MSAVPMEDLIKTVNKLQDAFTILGYDPLSLPQICVVGGQSAGKSSVLENIVGRDFLPRGSGIVTRRPLVIQMTNVPGLNKDEAEFLHKPGVVLTDFQAVKKEIVDATDAETSSSKGISDKPISLKIRSANVLNLTIVDLPGMTRVPVGDQPPDIDRQIRQMILKFITPKNAIILAVTAANTDLANSDALQLAREVDPEGLRTIGVITKVDIMDRGTNAMDVLEGRVIPLRLGYIAVINRAQEDIDTGKKIEAQWDAEKRFFQNHEVYRKIAERCGTVFLTKTLNRTLIGHIRTCLPEIKTKISSFMQEKRVELARYAELDGEGSMQRLVLHALSTYAEKFKTTIGGMGDEVQGQRLAGGARIAFIFRETFGRKILETDYVQKVSDKEIITTIRNATGLRGGLFIPDHSFEAIVRRLIHELDAPSKECVRTVFEELLTIANTIETSEMQRFPRLAQSVHDTARDLLHRCMDPTMKMVETLMDMEVSRINTNHPDFIGNRTAVNQLMAEVAQDARRRREEAAGYEEYEEAPLPPAPVAPAPVAPNAAPLPPAPVAPGANPLLAAAAATAANGQIRRAPGPPGTAPPPPGDAPARPELPAGVTPAAGATIRRKVVSRPPGAPAPARGPNGPNGVKSEIEVLEDSMNERERMETEVIRRLMRSYFEIIKKKIIDSIPKCITLFMIQKATNGMHDTLVSTLYKDETVKTMLEESEETISRRNRCREVLKMMEQSMKAIDEVEVNALNTYSS